MARHRRYDDDAFDDDAFDENGVLRDGRRVRVPMMMRDGLSEVQRAVSADAEARGTSAEMRMVDEHRAARGLVPLALDDGTTVDLPPWKASIVTAARCGLHDDGSLSLNWPGYRFAADGAGAEAKARAYAEMVRDMCDAWKSPARPPAGAGNVNGEVARMHDTGDAVRDAYLDSVADLTSAWSRKA